MGDYQIQSVELTSVHEVKQDFFNMEGSSGSYLCDKRVQHQEVEVISGKEKESPGVF